MFLNQMSSPVSNKCSESLVQIVLKVGRFADGPFGALCYRSMYYLLIGPQLDRCFLGAVDPSLNLFLILVWSV